MRKLWTPVAVAIVLLSACGREQGPRASNRPGADRAVVRAASTAVSLESFDACAPLVDHLRTEALARVGPYGLPGGVRSYAVADTAMAAERDAAPQAQTATTGAAPSYSGTNVQETNVDEPDIVKTDGRHIFTLRTNPSDGAQRLVAVAVDGGKPTKASDIGLPQAFGYQLLLAGDRVLAMGQKGGYGIAESDARIGAPAIAPAQEPGTVIAVVDVSDRANMRITNTIELDGSYGSARMVDGIARIVLNTQTNQIAFDLPTSSTVGAQQEALAANKAKIRKAGVNEWFPRYELQDDSGKVVSEGPITACDSTFAPKTFSGFGEMSVVTIDPSNPDPRNSASVIGSAGTVYASTSNLYVATQDWPQPEPLVLRDAPVPQPAPFPAPAKTVLHRFDISDPARAVYAASGEVRGNVLNQWSLSEHEGFLRVATTEDRFSPEGPGSSSSFVTVLDAKTDKLTRVASVDDLAPGERIYGVRFIGALGYVVTFRQIDPLHVIDLSDPAHPQVLGELEIPGYSAYLHPVGDGLLLGIGKDADTDGRVLGTSISLFDVSDPTRPRRLDVENLADAYTQVEYDHHAFTWWEPRHLALIPVDLQNIQTTVVEPSEPDAPSGSGTAPGSAGGSGGSDPGAGQIEPAPPEKVAPTSYLYGFGVQNRTITKLGRLTHQAHAEQYAGQISRSIVIDDTLFSISSSGIAASDPASFAETGWLSLV